MRVQRSRRLSWQVAAEPPPPLRVPVEIGAKVQEHLSCPLDVVIKDLALTEVRLWAGFRLEPARVALLFLPGLGPLKCRVQWSRNWYAALQLDQPIHPSVIRQLAARHPPAANRMLLD